VLAGGGRGVRAEVCPRRRTQGCAALSLRQSHPSETVLCPPRLPPPSPSVPLQAAGGTDALLARYKTSAVNGIGGTPEDVADRIAQFGENKFPEAAFESWWSIFFDCFKDIILIILMVAAVVSLSVGIYEHGGKTGWIDGVAILIAVVVVATVTATNDYNKQLQVRGHPSSGACAAAATAGAVAAPWERGRTDGAARCHWLQRFHSACC